MSDSFDPYYIWLGIPPKDQPPNHYRLLGLQDQEENTDVIDAAANRQTTYLHEMSAGPRRAESQQLLNEVAAARRCLLSPEKKQEYDGKLKADQAAVNAASQPAAALPTAVPIAKAVAPTPAPQINADESTVTEIPAFNFSPPATSNAPATDDGGFPSFDTQPGSGSVSPVQKTATVASTSSASTPKAASKKPIPKQLIIAGCSIVVVVIAAFLFSNGSTSEKKSQSAGTSTRLDGQGSAVRGNSASPGKAKAPDDSGNGDPKADSGRALFDMEPDPDSIFKVQSNFGSKEKKEE